MTRAQPASTVVSLPYAVVAEPGATVAPSNAFAPLARQLVWLALPILAEHVLHMLVGMTDTYLAGHLPDGRSDATAAVGAVTYVLWLMGLLAGAIGTGSTAIIARAIGARHRSLANSVCGQSITVAAVSGMVMSGLVIALAAPMARLTDLHGDAHDFALYYLRVLCLSLPFSMVMFAANACLRGAGDTLTPAIAMIFVDVVNMVASFALTRGWFGLPVMGFRGIAVGTVIAYAVGGLIQFAVLVHGRKSIRLHLHRLWPHWATLRRVLRIGVPSGVEGLLTWLPQFEILRVINGIDPTNVLSAAHIVTIRVESLSYMGGLAIATAAATMVGQSLGMKSPARATRSAYLSFGLAVAMMASWGVVFALFGRQLASVLTADPAAAAMSGKCLFITSFAQIAFASAIVFGGALRGAGDTLVVMAVNMASTVGLRLSAVLFVTLYLHLGLQAIWIVLASELTFRGAMMYLRFMQGGWKHIRV